MNALIRSRLPIATAHEAMTTGRRYGGDDARAAGIVAATASEGEVVDSAVARDEELAAGFALRATGKAFYICDATVPRQRVPEMMARGQQIAASHGLDILKRDTPATATCIRLSSTNRASSPPSTLSQGRLPTRRWTSVAR